MFVDRTEETPEGNGGKKTLFCKMFTTYTEDLLVTTWPELCALNF